MKKFICLALALTLSLQNAQAIPTPKSLGNLNKVKNAAGFTFGIKSGDKIFFTRADAEHGYELWISDGTESGTSLLKDIFPGTESSLPVNFTAVKFSGVDGVYFTAVDSDGRELWKSDGTLLGTQKVINLDGSDDGVSEDFFYSSRIIVYPGTSNAVFAGNDANGAKLFKTDGTELGTSIIDDAFFSGDNYSPRSLYLNPNDLKIYFSADSINLGIGREPYYTDGTTITAMGDINIGGSSSPYSFNVTADGSRIVFVANDGIVGSELWSFDGMTSSLVSDLSPGDDSYFAAFETTDSTLILGRAVFNETPGTITGQLIKTDGAALGAGTSVIKDLDCLPGSVYSYEAPDLINSIAEINGKAIFPCYNYQTGFTQLWSSDGTTEGTKVLKEIKLGLSVLSALYPGDNKVMFIANNAKNGMELWSTDGTKTGTQMVLDANPGEGGFFSSLQGLESLEILLIFASPAKSGSTGSIFAGISGKQQKILFSNGETSNSVVIADQSEDTDQGSNPREFISFNNKVFFSATGGVKETELFSTDGKASGTKLFKNIAIGQSSNPSNFVRISHLNKMIFKADDGINGQAIWISDGTSEGTKLLKDTSDVNPNIFFYEGDIIQLYKAHLGKKYFFTSYSSTAGTQLWTTNGTKRGTRLLKDINLTDANSDISQITRLGNKVIFVTDDRVLGRELWVSDATAEGTTILKDINPGIDSSSPDNLTRVGDKLYFTAYDIANGNEIWVTDGTSDGTKLLKDIDPGGSSSSTDHLTAVGNFLFFFASNGVDGYKLWRSDGTESGTVMLETADPGIGYSSPQYIAPIGNGSVIFSAYENTAGTELFKATADINSVELIKDINASGNSNPVNLHKARGRNLVYFSANDGVAGRELWVTDGTNAGTIMLADIYAGSDSSNPENFYSDDKRVYFSAITEESGREPFAVKLP